MCIQVPCVYLLSAASTVIRNINSYFKLFLKGCCMRFLPGLCDLFILICAVVHSAFDSFKGDSILFFIFCEIIILTLLLVSLKLRWSSIHSFSLKLEFIALFQRDLHFIEDDLFIWLLKYFFRWYWVVDYFISAGTFFMNVAFAAYTQPPGCQSARVCSVPDPRLLHLIWKTDTPDQVEELYTSLPPPLNNADI